MKVRLLSSLPKRPQPNRVLEQTVQQRRFAYCCPAAQHNRYVAKRIASNREMR